MHKIDASALQPKLKTVVAHNEALGVLSPSELATLTAALQSDSIGNVTLTHASWALNHAEHQVTQPALRQELVDRLQAQGKAVTPEAIAAFKESVLSLREDITAALKPTRGERVGNAIDRFLGGVSDQVQLLPLSLEVARQRVTLASLDVFDKIGLR